MILLNVEDYCQDCPGFEPEMERMRIEEFATTEQSWSTVIVCSNRRKCKRMYEHVRREFFKANAEAIMKEEKYGTPE